MSAAPPLEAVLVALEALREEIAAMHAEVRKLRRELRRHQAGPALLIEALVEFFGEGSRFTAAGVLRLADEEPHGPIAQALADLIDMNGSPRGRATALGTRLRRMPGIQIVARAHGCAVFRVASPTEVT
jgi:hypothetical protein